MRPFRPFRPLAALVLLLVLAAAGPQAVNDPARVSRPYVGVTLIARVLTTPRLARGIGIQQPQL